MAALPGATLLQNSLSSLGALPDSQRSVLAKNAFDNIARETSVPANVLIALDEAAGGGGDADRAKQAATTISDLVRNGRSIEDAVATVTGDARRSRAILDRAYDIADTLYPAPAAPPPEKKSGGFMSTAKDVGKTLAGAAISGAGMAVDAAGALGDEAARALIGANEQRAGRDAASVGTTPIRDFGRWLGNDVIGGAGRAVSESASPEFKQAMADSSFKGDITAPSTWQLPDNPSVAGTIGVGAQVAGSLIPVLLSGSARGAALIGGLMGGGEGVQNGRQFVLDAAKTVGDDGRPEIEKLPGYQELVIGGATPEQATAELARRAENDAGFREGLISAVGGAATSRIFHTAEGWLGSGGRLARAAKKAGAGFTEEGTQEVAENAAAQSGINAATGAETNIFDDSLQNFIAGGMGGGMAGAVGGATGRQPPRQTPPPPAPEPLGALPPPPLGLPAPTGPGYRPDFVLVDPRTDYVPNWTMRDPEPEREPAGPGLPPPPARLALPAPSNSRDTGAVGSDAGAVAASGTPDLSAGGPGAAAMPAAPIGPIDAIAKGIAARTPAAAPAPTQRFPDQKPGAAIRLGDPETGEIVDGVFLRETPSGALVRLQGREVELTPEQFDAYRDTEPMIDAATKQAEKERAKNVEPRRPGEPTPASDVARPVSVLDVVAPGGEGTVSSRTADEERAAPVPPLDGPRMPTQQDDQESESGDARRVAVADGAANASADVGSVEAATQRAADLRREASRIRKQAKTPSDRPKEERRAEMRRADEMVREAAAIEDGLKAPPTTSAPRRTEWLRKRIAFLEGQAKASGWDARLLAQRQEAQRELDTLTTKPDDAKQNAAPKRPTTPRDFWTYQADEPPAVPPAGVAIEPEDWDTLSPGMRREIARDAARRSAQKSKSEESETTDTSEIVDAAANEAATSPQNDLPEPTQAQKEAGNYKLGRVHIGGMDISIENPKGSERRGTDPNGKPWAVTMPAHYGYVRRTEGADGDHVDVYIGDHPDSDRVFVVDQHDANTGVFDEHKSILGTNSREEAVALYDAGFSDGKGPQRRRAVTEMTVPEFREWAESGDTKAPIGGAEDQNGDIGVPDPDQATPMTKRRAGHTDPSQVSRRQTPKKRDAYEAFLDRLENYFRPGRIVPSYFGEDRVVAFHRPTGNGNGTWSVTVRAVNDSGSPLIDARERNHSTLPSDRTLSAWERDHPVGDTAAEPTKFARVRVDNSPVVAESNDRNTLTNVENFASSLRVDLTVSENNGVITLAKINARQREIGAGTRVMDALIRYADETGQRIVLTPSKDFGASSIKRLVEFYKRFGFIENKGRTKDFSTRETMIREPAKLARIRIDDSPVVAEITGDELGSWSDIRQLGRKAAAWYRQTFLSGDEPATVTNANNGWVIQFNKAGAGKIGGRKGEDLYKAVVALPQILERGILVSSEPDNRGRPDIKAIHKIAATVKIGGRDVPLVATVRETADGLFHYDLSREMEGGRTESAEPQGRARLGQPALEGASSDINIDFDTTNANPAGNDNLGREPFPDIGKMSATEYREWAMSGDAKAIEAALNEALDRVGIKSRVGAFLSSRAPLNSLGSYRYGWISIFRQGNSWRRTLDHEIVHALRDSLLWGGDYGLFTADEWRALVKAARRNDKIRNWVEKSYEGLDTAGRSEEMVAEFYSAWAAGKYTAPPKGPLLRALERIGQFLRAAASAMRGEGFVDTANILEKIADGSIGRRQNAESFGPEPASAPPYSARVEGDPEIKEQRIDKEFREALQTGKGRALGMIGSLNWAKTGKVFENWLTDAMGKHDSVNILSLVPGYSLFSELGKGLPGAQKYLRFKQQMDADRNELQARSAEIVDRWVNTARRDTEANDRLMDLMHDSTLAGIDPTDPDGWRRLADIGATEVGPKASKEERERAVRVKADMEARRKTWEGLKARYDKLPKRFQELYVEVRDEYGRMSDLTDAALMENIRAAASIAVKQAKRAHRKELQRIEDDGLTGQERADAIGKANDRLAQAMARNANSKLSKLTSLRQMFESNKLLGPYFPLARFGGYYATVRDASGKVVSFSRFETKAAQDEFIRRAEAEKLGKVEHGVLGAGANLKGMVDPRFVAEVETLLLDAGADAGLQDAIWQRWLETLPDQSMRKGRIHRKGRLGFDRDAIRAFSSAMFHGAHQLARLRYSLEMGEALNEAEEEAAAVPAPERAGFVVREMRKRHEFTMSPTNNPLVTAASNLAFIWYLGASPATALVNLSQTTIVGVPVLAARFKKLGVSGATRQLGRALRDFGTGRGSVVKRINGVPVWTNTWSVENSPRLNADEKRAMAAGYKRGVIDKTQSHDLASVAETGVEYNPTRERVMRAISFMFHHTERLNREVTYLAAYRMARADGMAHDEAVDEAAGLTWKTHFSYQNTDRPRIMQSDMGKILTTFRNFTANMLFRLFRDTHEAFKGATAEERREARAQLIGVTLSLFAHAGIRGVWGYGMLMTLLGLFLPGGADDQDEWLQDALLMNGDGPGVAAWNWTMGMALNGVPGAALGVDLTNRIGMPDLWFRSPDKDLEGKDLWSFYTEQILGPVAAIGGGALSGLSMVADGQVVRGLEKMVPNAVSDVLKAGRYTGEGVTTYYGDPIIENTNPWEVLMTAAGFTPGRIAERYEINNRLKRREKEITEERKDIQRDVGDAIRAGQPVPEKALKRMQAFNTAYPEFPITPKSIRQSVRAREQSSARNEFGVSLNPKLNARLREERAPTVHSSNRSTPARPELADQSSE